MTKANRYSRIRQLLESGQIGIPTANELWQRGPSPKLSLSHEQLATAYMAAARTVMNGVPVEKTKIWTDEAWGMKIIVDPDMPPGSFWIGYDPAKSRNSDLE